MCSSDLTGVFVESQEVLSGYVSLLAWLGRVLPTNAEFKSLAVQKLNSGNDHAPTVSSYFVYEKGQIFSMYRKESLHLVYLFKLLFLPP